MQNHFQYQPYQPVRKPISEQLLRIGTLLLGLDVVCGILSFCLAKASTVYDLNTVPYSLIALPLGMVAGMFVGLGIPTIVIGVLFLLIGITIRRLRASGSLVNQIIGMFSLGMGGLSWVPTLLVPDDPAHTSLLWITALNAIFIGFPLPIVGLAFLVIGIIGAAEETSSKEQPKGEQRASGSAPFRERE